MAAFFLLKLSTFALYSSKSGTMKLSELTAISPIDEDIELKQKS